MKLKKILIPIVVGLCFILYWIYIVIVVERNTIDRGLSLFVTIPLVSAIGCMIYVVLQRIQEIRGGEEDDLDNY